MAVPGARVEDAMSASVLCVSLGATLGRIAATMAREKRGYAVVMERGAVVGVVTMAGALRTLGRVERGWSVVVTGLEA